MDRPVENLDPEPALLEPVDNPQVIDTEPTAPGQEDPTPASAELSTVSTAPTTSSKTILSEPLKPEPAVVPVDDLYAERYGS